jgi:hypothetical protein
MDEQESAVPRVRGLLLPNAAGPFLSEQRAEFEPDDAQLCLDLYREADPEDAFDHFEEQRETNIEFMRGLPGSDGSRVALHNEAGEITMAQMLHEWAMHDLGHIRQFAELVRARKYLEGSQVRNSNS